MRLVQNLLHQEVVGALRKQIFTSVFEPGSFLGEVVRSERLEISHLHPREALKVLTSDGLLRQEPRRRFFDNEIIEQSLNDIFPGTALPEERGAHQAARIAHDADSRSNGADFAIRAHLECQRAPLRKWVCSRRSRFAS